MEIATMPHANITLKLNNAHYNVMKLEGQEGLAQLFYFNVTVVTDISFDFHQCLGKNAALILMGSEGVTRKIIGIISAVQHKLQNDLGQHHTTLLLQPRLSVLQATAEPRIFLSQSYIDIIKLILHQGGYNDLQLHWQLQQQYPIQPYTVQIFGETDLAFLKRLIAKAGLFFWSDITSDGDNECLHLSDSLLHCPSRAAALIYKPARGLHTYNSSTKQIETVIQELEIRYQEKNYQLKATTNIFNLMTGEKVQINDIHLFPGEQEYLIIRLHHHAAHTIENIGDEIAYNNFATLIPSQAKFENPSPKLPLFPIIFPAKIESDHDAALLNEHGEYRLRHPFDLSQHPHTDASISLPRLSPYGGTASNNVLPVSWHTPLKNQSEVWVGCLHGDPDQPIILGTVPNSKQVSPVTQKNNTQHRLLSHQYHELCFDDQPQQEKIILKTGDGKNYLVMNHQTEKPNIMLASENGTQHWQAKQTIRTNVAGDATENINNQRQHHASQDYLLQTEQGDIRQEAHRTYQLQAQQTISHQAGGQLNIDTINDFNLHARQHINFSAQGKQLELQSLNENLLLQAGHALTITGSGKGNLEFRQQQAGFRITPEGTVELFGKKILAQAQTQVKFLGEVRYEDSD